MTQALYAHMNNKTIKKKERVIERMDLIKLYYMHMWKYHNKTLLYNQFNKNMKKLGY
jgi:hypothetical protein